VPCVRGNAIRQCIVFVLVPAWFWNVYLPQDAFELSGLIYLCEGFLALLLSRRLVSLPVIENILAGAARWWPAALMKRAYWLVDAGGY